MARPPGAKANLLITFTLGDIIKGPSLFLSVSMHMWKSRKAGERATESGEAEEKSGGAGGKGYEAGIPCCYCGICWTCPVNMKGQSGLRLGESARTKHVHAGNRDDKSLRFAFRHRGRQDIRAASEVAHVSGGTPWWNKTQYQAKFGKAPRDLTIPCRRA